MEQQTRDPEPTITAKPHGSRPGLARRALGVLRELVIRSDQFVCEVARRVWLWVRDGARWLVGAPDKSVESGDPAMTTPRARHDAILASLCEVDHMLRSGKRAVRRLERGLKKHPELGAIYGRGVEMAKRQRDDLTRLREELVIDEKEARADLAAFETAQAPVRAETWRKRREKMMDAGRELSDRFDDVAAKVERGGRTAWSALSRRQPA